MNITCTPTGIIGLEHPKKGILTLKKSGFSNILLDLTMSCPSSELENLGKPEKTKKKENEIKKEKILVSRQPERLSESINPLLSQCQEQQMHISIARAPYLPYNTKRIGLTALLSKLAKESIKACGLAGCKQLIVQPLFAGILQEDEWEVNRGYYLDLVDIAREYNVTILLANQCRDFNGHLLRGICADAEEAAVWIDGLNKEAGEERFAFCMDVGICTLCGQDTQEFVMTLGNRIKAVIIRDCDGYHETSMLPFTCVDQGQSQTNWLNLIRGLREICFDGTLVMDFSSTIETLSHLFRPQIIQLAKTIADYFKWQIGMKTVMQKYDKRVLFGAGNMCRNYMKCYGEEFPPLFTCDNNADRWGDCFEGLEIRPPEALKELPPDCAVFICNVYYREIEEQLRQMGICNPIEYFNDEYMPSYYFDRLEYWKDGES
ncbi:MAG: hypothetical protein NC434_01995 [Ruminococcus sp.]|nr:hypothetical protein [Ruminococcus sp.]